MTTNIYKVVKVRLKDIVRGKTHINFIEGAVKRMNLLCSHVYQFLRLWYISQKHKKNIEFNKTMITMCIRTLAQNTRGPKPSRESLEYQIMFQKFYEEVYSKLNYEPINVVNLSYIYSYTSTQIITAIENNIKAHYQEYVRRFVNVYFKQLFQAIYDKISDKKELAELKKTHTEDLIKVKNDIFNNTLTSPEQYHMWLGLYKYEIVPENFDQDKFYTNSQPYLKYMFFMSNYLELTQKKQFQIFPLRTNLVPKHITFDTHGITDLLANTFELRQYDGDKNKIWNHFFKLELFKRNNYVFDHMITTNGYDASILFIQDDKKEVKEESLSRRANSSGKSKRMYATMEDNDVKEYKQQQKDQQYEKQLSQQKERRAKKKKETKQEKRLKREFMYLEDVSDEELEYIRNANKAIIDPGRHNILTMLHNGDKIYKYTNKENSLRNQKQKLANKRMKLKDITGISVIEQCYLNGCNSKSCNIEKFKEYISARNSVLSMLTQEYARTQFRQYNFYSYINKTRARDNLVNTIKKTIGGEEQVLIVGDWSANTNLKHTAPTPGIGLKRYLAKHFKVFDIHEYKTSKLHHKTKEECKNLYLDGKKIHSVLTYKMENSGRVGVINRDRNAVFNMRKIVNQVLIDRTYPSEFSRTNNAGITTVKP